MRRRVRRLPGAIAVVVATLVGCGGSSASTVTVVADAASQTIRAHTARVAVILSLGASGRGSVDFQAGAVQLDFGNEQVVIIGDDTYTLQSGAARWTHSHIAR